MYLKTKEQLQRILLNNSNLKDIILDSLKKLGKIMSLKKERKVPLKERKIISILFQFYLDFSKKFYIFAL